MLAGDCIACSKEKSKKVEESVSERVTSYFSDSRKERGGEVGGTNGFLDPENMLKQAKKKG